VASEPACPVESYSTGVSDVKQNRARIRRPFVASGLASDVRDNVAGKLRRYTRIRRPCVVKDKVARRT